MGDGIEPDGEAKIGSFLRYIEGRPLTDQGSLTALLSAKE
jgi:hypothetical protein